MNKKYKKYKINNKKIIAVLLVVFMTISNFVFFDMTAFAADDLPYIVISSINMPYSVQAGSVSVEAVVIVKNNYLNKIPNVSVTAKDTSGAINITTNNKKTADIDAYSEVSYSFYFNVGSAEGVYDITFTVEYNGGRTITESRRINVTAPPQQQSPQDPNFEILSEMHPRQVAIGNDMKISLGFVNKGGLANGVTVEITYDPAEGIIPFLTTASSHTKIFIGTILPGQSYNCYWNFNVTNEAAAVLHTFTIKITSAESKSSMSYPIGIMFEKNTNDTAKTTPDIKIISTELPGKVQKGDQFEIKAILENIGADAKDIKAAIEFPKGINYYSAPEIRIGFLNQNEQTEIVFKAVVTNDADLNYNSFALKIKYNKTETIEKEEVYNIGLLVFGKETAATNLTINASAPSAIKIDEDFKVLFTVTNNGPDEKNLFAKIDSPAGLINKSYGNYIPIGDLKSGESKTYESIFAATGEAAGKYAVFCITLFGKQTAGADNLFAEQYIMTFVSNIDLPKMIIDSIKFPQNVSVDETFNVDVTVANTGAANAENVKLTVTSPAGILNTTANEIMIDSVKSGGKTTVTVNYRIGQNVKYGYNPFIVSLSYASENISQYFGVTVNSSDLRIDSVKIPSMIGVNRDFNVEVAIKNTGADANDVIISLAPQSGLINKTSNIVKIDSIKSGEIMTAAFTFMAVESAPNGYVAIDINLSHGEESIKQYSGLIINNPPKKDDENKPGDKDKNDIPVVIISKFTYTNVESEPPANNNNSDNNAMNNNNNNNNNGKDMPEAIMPREDIDIFTKTSIISVLPDAPAAVSPAPGVNSPGYSNGNNFGGFPSSSPNGGNTPQKNTNAVYGGKTFIFTIELLNTHKSIAVKDLKITISQEKGIFNPKSGSNTFFVERLEPGQTVEENIELLVKSDADPDSYGITISLSYKSENGEPTSSSEIINIPVQQEMRFSIGDLQPINDIEMGDEAYVNVQFGNLGKSWIYNVVVRVQGDGFMNQQGTYYAGNIEKGKFLAYEFTLVPFNPGFMNGAFLFTYEDADGNTYEEQQPFFFNVMGDMGEMPPIDDTMIIGPDGLPVINTENEENPEETGGFWLFTNMNFMKWAIIIGGGLFVVAVVIVIIVIAVKKSKKNQSNADDDDD